MVDLAEVAGPYCLCPQWIMNKANICILCSKNSRWVIFGLRWEAHTHLQVHWELNVIVFRGGRASKAQCMWLCRRRIKVWLWKKKKEQADICMFQHTNLQLKICLHSLWHWAAGLFQNHFVFLRNFIRWQVEVSQPVKRPLTPNSSWRSLELSDAHTYGVRILLRRG